MTGVLFHMKASIAFLALLAAAGAANSAGAPESTSPVLDISAPALEREVGRISGASAGPNQLWPGFDPLAIPLAVYDGARTWLFRHPGPPEGFEAVFDSSIKAFAFPGRFPAITANTSADVGGVATGTVMLDRNYPGRSLTRLAAMAVHEAFHVYQRAKHPGWSGNEGDLFNYPAEDADLLKLRRLETEALRRALAAASPTDAAPWSRLALDLRLKRYEGMDSTLAIYERKTELNEGVAAWVEYRAAGKRELEFPAGGFGPAEVRLRAYTTGPALALLLSRFSPGWAGELERNDDQYLDVLLSGALPSGPPGTFSPAEMEAAERSARQDVTALTARRARLASEFEAKAGWRIVVEAADDQPLWPQGFDPLNVELVGPGRVLHARFLKLGNESGTVEILDAGSLTEAAGPHPLFNGVRRLVVTGLTEPQVTEAGTGITIEAPGFSGRFDRARVARGEEAIVIRLH